MDGTLTDPNDGELLARPTTAARLADVSQRTIYYWIKTGRVRVRYASGGAVLVEVKSLFSRERPEIARTHKPTGDTAAA